MTALWMIVLCGVLSIVYAIWATASVMKADAGNPRMQEIAAAVAEGQKVEFELKTDKMRGKVSAENLQLV